MQGHHSPGFRHDSAKLPLDADRLAKHPHVGRQERENGGPVAEERIQPTAVRNADKNQDVGNAIGQIVQNFSTPARFAGGEGNHTVHHIEPEAQIAEAWRDQEQNSVRVRLPKAKGGERSRND